MTVLTEARRLHDLGFAILWLKTKSKMPIEAGWTKGPRKTWKELEASYVKGYNVGVLLGSASEIIGNDFETRYLAVIDLDIKSEDPKHKKEALAAVQKIIAHISPPKVASGRGNGSAHFYFVTREPFKAWNPAHSDEMVKVMMPSKRPSKNEIDSLTPDEIVKGFRLSRAWEVSLYSEGRQVVLPPSIHPDSGKAYTWAKGGIEGGITAEYPPPLLDIARGAATSNKSKKTGKRTLDKAENDNDVPEFDIDETLDVTWAVPELSEDMITAIKTGIWRGKEITDNSAFMLLAATALYSAGLDSGGVLSVLSDPTTQLGNAVYANHVQSKSRKQAVKWLWNYTVKKIWQEKDSKKAFVGAPLEESPDLDAKDLASQNAEIEADLDWRDELGRSDKGVKLSLKNMDIILSNLIDKAVFKHNFFASRDEYGVAPPWMGEKGKAAQAGDYLTDKSILVMRRWVSDTEFNFEPKKELANDVVTLIGQRNAYHPVRDFLNSLTWDKTPRISTWIKTYINGQAPEPYLSEISRLIILAMVKRVFEPGCQWDYTPVFESDQGFYKSSIIRALVGEDKWFADNLPDLKDKDALLNLQGKWVIELSELSATKRSDYSKVKSYLNCRCDSVRSPYGMRYEDIPRQNVFIGTVNEGEYLKDPTGNRRFCPICVGFRDLVMGKKMLDQLKEDRKQLFAEAMHIYRTDKTLVLDFSMEAKAQAKEAQTDRMVEDDGAQMNECMLDFIDNEDRKLEEEKLIDFNRFSLNDLITGVGKPWGQWQLDKQVRQKGAVVLRKLGFSRTHINGRSVWYQGNKVGPRARIVPKDDPNDDFDQK